jgi:predicted nucleotidyltransferase
MGKTVELLRWCVRNVIRGIKVKIYQGHLDRKLDSYRYGNILEGEVITASLFQKK